MSMCTPSSVIQVLLRYDRYRGVISLVSIQDGIIQKGWLTLVAHRLRRLVAYRG